MQYLRVKIPYKSSEWIKLIPLGDIHLGNSSTDLPKLKAIVKYIREKKDTYWIGMGDYVEAINYTDPRFDPNTIDARYLRFNSFNSENIGTRDRTFGNLDKLVQLQIKDLVEILRPIRNKCIGLLRGNHEEAIRKHNQYDVLYEIAKDLELDRNMLLYDTAIVRMLFERDTILGKRCHSKQIDILVSHGNAGGRTYGYKSNRLSELAKWFIADIYLLAHSHTKQAQSSTQIYFDRFGNQKKKKVIAAITGCFLKSYDVDKNSYAEKMCLPPTDIGVTKLMIQPETGDIHISL